ncbi:hypothetical protein B0T21DRAFT_371127 [Apiosordaria backusii]|uniref:Uncharacterized protein n=1 Tax=Apiosordaria backusii TaxID=314023 RepID=A0AA40E317_9PEZI|nr:hypothetical protein B0T21DRAFT_371127 [Apiosordaria backusii]
MAPNNGNTSAKEHKVSTIRGCAVHTTDGLFGVFPVADIGRAIQAFCNEKGYTAKDKIFITAQPVAIGFDPSHNISEAPVAAAPGSGGGNVTHQPAVADVSNSNDMELDNASDSADYDSASVSSMSSAPNGQPDQAAVADHAATDPIQTTANNVQPIYNVQHTNATAGRSPVSRRLSKMNTNQGSLPDPEHARTVAGALQKYCQEHNIDMYKEFDLSAFPRSQLQQRAGALQPGEAVQPAQDTNSGVTQIHNNVTTQSSAANSTLGAGPPSGTVPSGHQNALEGTRSAGGSPAQRLDAKDTKSGRVVKSNAKTKAKPIPVLASSEKKGRRPSTKTSGKVSTTNATRAVGHAISGAAPTAAAVAGPIPGSVPGSVPGSFFGSVRGPVPAPVAATVAAPAATTTASDAALTTAPITNPVASANALRVLPGLSRTVRLL